MQLLNRLREAAPNDRDLQAVLTTASGGSIRLLPQDKVEFTTPGPNSKVFATVKFRRGRINQLVPGPALSSRTAQDALVEQVRNECAPIHGTYTAHRILLARKKLTGSFKWMGVLRLDPLPQGVPIGHGLDWFAKQVGGLGKAHDGPPYPFILQVRVPSSPNPLVQSGRYLRALDKYQNAITLLISGHISGFARSTDRSWTQVSRDAGIENHLLYEGFSLGDHGAIPDFDSPFEHAAKVFKGDYYNHLWGGDTEMLLPPSLAEDLATADALESNDADAMSRSMYWYAIALANRLESTVSTVAFSTSIECLLPDQKRLRCTICAAQIGNGPTHWFKAHIARYGTLPAELHAQRAAIYDVRSALVHGRFAATVDVGCYSAANRTGVDDLLIEVVARRSLLNWLRDPHRREWTVSEHTHIVKKAP